MTTRVMPNGVSTTTDYDGMGRMKFWKNQASGGGVLNEFIYSYNTANQITQITEPTVKTRTFGYDNADRLTSSTSTVSGQNESYTFDDVGNRTSSHLSSVYGYQQGSFNRLTATQQASYSFDNNGNLTSKTEGTAKWYYSYDRENRLMNATKFGGLTPRANESINYQYDALGRRVVRQDKKTGRTEFTHDGMDVIQDRFEKNDGSTSTTNYINGLGIDDKLKLTNGTTSRYFLTDHLGSTVGMADTNGNITESASYDSFGRTISSNLTTRYGFTGRETDEATGLMYYRARFYDPQVGRFISEDPIGFDGGDVNLYGYVWNSPIRFTDPEGLRGNEGYGRLVEDERRLRIIEVEPNWQNFRFENPVYQLALIINDFFLARDINELILFKPKNVIFDVTLAKIGYSDCMTGTPPKGYPFGWKKGDDRGHIIGAQLGGSGDYPFTFGQNPRINQGPFKGFENQIRRYIQDHPDQTVDVQVQLLYGQGQFRPNGVYYTVYFSNGTQWNRYFTNP